MCDRVKRETVTSHIPVILLTARTQEDQRAEGYDYGADAYITKPFSGKVLLARVKNLLANRRLLRDVFSNGEVMDDKPKDADTLFINEFRKQVQAQMADSELNVETLSADMGMSRVQLYRKVKALTGASPVELIRITRLKRAERLLKTGSKTIAEISYEVGFSSPSYFSKCFKDYFGVLPGEVK
jgi:AraC-like DNA-binding protein